MVNMDSGHNEPTAELNLVPFIDILSTCICFLLMTTIWIQLGSFNISQAAGSSGAQEKNPPSIAVDLKPSGEVKLTMKDLPGHKNQVVDSVPARGGEIDFATFAAKMNQIHASYPDLKTVMLMPTQGIKFDDVIKTMQVFRDRQMAQIGLVPISQK